MVMININVYQFTCFIILIIFFDVLGCYGNYASTDRINFPDLSRQPISRSSKTREEVLVLVAGEEWEEVWPKWLEHVRTFKIGL